MKQQVVVMFHFISRRCGIMRSTLQRNNDCSVFGTCMRLHIKSTMRSLRSRSFVFGTCKFVLSKLFLLAFNYLLTLLDPFTQFTPNHSTHLSLFLISVQFAPARFSVNATKHQSKIDRRPSIRLLVAQRVHCNIYISLYARNGLLMQMAVHNDDGVAKKKETCKIRVNGGLYKMMRWKLQQNELSLINAAPREANIFLKGDVNNVSSIHVKVSHRIKLTEKKCHLQSNFPMAFFALS